VYLDSPTPPKLFQVGDLWNFLSAVFFGVHMLRTEHISRSTKKEDFLPLLGYEVSLYHVPMYLIQKEPKKKKKNHLFIVLHG
jgi:hypothetical protein